MDTQTKHINRSQRLFIELGTALLLEPETPDRSASSQLIGMQVGRYLIVQLAEHTWKRSRLSTDETLHARYILSDDVFEFKTRIIRIIEDPDYLLFLDYPKVVESCNIRSEKRVECFLPVRMTLDKFCLNGIITNINRNGCLCVVDDIPGFDSCSTEYLTLNLPYGRVDTLSIKARIRSTRKKGNQISFGLLFENLEGFSKNVLSALVPALKI
ncbi:MAG: flagellar brake protein [Desulfobacteraceae bacterium]|nr:flagellar brake protein [Desulfobacteraceae bacterium]